MATNYNSRWRASQNQSSDDDADTLIANTEILLGKNPRAKPKPKPRVVAISIEPVVNAVLNIVDLNVGATQTSFQMVPPWFQPIDRTAIRQKTVYPRNISDKRPYDTIACYRSSIGRSTDFNNEPIQMNVDSPETMMLSLDAFAQQFGGQLSFTSRNLSFSNSVEQMSSGVANMGSVHLLATDSLPTAVFHMKVNLNYQRDLARTPETMQNFALGFSTAIARTVGCSNDYVRMLSVSKSNGDSRTSDVEVGLTLPDPVQTKNYADTLQVIISKDFLSK